MKRVRIEAHDAVEHSTPKQLLQEILAAHRWGQIAAAKHLYASVLNLDPTNPAGIANLAIIAAQEGDLAGAEGLFRQEITLRPNDPVASTISDLFCSSSPGGLMRSLHTAAPSSSGRIIPRPISRLAMR
jgi:hypothetical protein